MRAEIPRIMIAGAGSGSGKTTLTCALLLVMKKRGLNPAAFKCGPDYIDPMFHGRVPGIKSRNLDIFLCGENAVKHLLAENSRGRDLAVIEGVMGLYDGLGATDRCSSNHLSMLTGTPAVLAVDGGGAGVSLAAQIYGYRHFLPNSLKGIVINRCREKMYPFYKKLIEERLDLPVYGYLPPVPEALFPSRHLGLVLPDEIGDIREKLEALGEICARSADLDGLLALARSCEPLDYDRIPVERLADVPVGVALDPAFCFYYEDNFDLLRGMGARLEFFSPLRDASVPENVCGLIFGGGYPEEYAGELSGNVSMRESVRAAAGRGMPVLAECGGFLYLGRSLKDMQGTEYPMAGVFGSSAAMAPSLQRFGYVRLRAEKDNLLCRKGAELRAHEFHYSDGTDNGTAFTAMKDGGARWPCIHATDRIFAGYPHLHLWGAPDAAAGFISQCDAYRRERTA
jgi:cobyrinic acid a,c-diamide synthase